MDKEEIELIQKAQSGDEQAFSELYEKYTPLIKSVSFDFCRSSSNASISEEDFESEANLAFYSAVNQYKTERKVAFGYYLKKCIKNRLISFLRKINKKRKPRDTASGYDAETDYIRKAKAEKVMLEAEKRLSRYEKKVFDLYTERKKTYREIAKEVGKSEKSVDNAMCRIRSKLRDLK